MLLLNTITHATVELRKQGKVHGQPSLTIIHGPLCTLLYLRKELFCQLFFNGFHQVLELLGSITDGSMHQLAVFSEQVNPRNALVGK